MLQVLPPFGVLRQTQWMLVSEPLQMAVLKPEATSCVDLVAHRVATIHSQAESVPWLMTQQRFELLQMVCHVIHLIGDPGNYTQNKLLNMS